MEKQFYETPVIDVCEVMIEGSFAASAEPIIPGEEW